MKRLTRTVLPTLLVVALALAASPVLAGAMRVQDALWAGGTTWDTVLTPTSFKMPPRQSLDLIYDFSMSGLAGQRSIAESYPGQPDYNGGRWWVQMAVFTADGIAAHDADGDGHVDYELTSLEELQADIAAGYVETFETATYFECPLLK